MIFKLAVGGYVALVLTGAAIKLSHSTYEPAVAAPAPVVATVAPTAAFTEPDCSEEQNSYAEVEALSMASDIARIKEELRLAKLNSTVRLTY